MRVAQQTTSPVQWRWVALTLTSHVSEYQEQKEKEYFETVFIWNHSPDDVAVIDEVQMIEQEARGGAWTRAILGQLECES